MRSDFRHFFLKESVLAPFSILADAYACHVSRLWHIGLYTIMAKPIKKSRIALSNDPVFNNKYLFLEPEWVLSQKSMRPKDEWAIDSEAMSARGIIVSVKSN